VRVDGRPFGDDLASMLATKIFYPVALDEHGAELAPGYTDKRYYATATNADGTYDTSYNCSNWTDPNGDMSAGSVTSSAWSNDYATTCQFQWSILCMQTDYQAIVKPTPVAGARRAFQSDYIFDTTKGIAGADTICQTSASDANLSGTFLAFLATRTASAASRFSASGGPWARLDDTLIVANAGDLLQAQPKLLAPLDLTASGLYGGEAWSGASSPTAVGTNATTCSNWSANLATLTGASGYEWESDNQFFGYDTMTTCDSVNTVFCLEQ
jgi:hypothetical protein